MTSLLKLTNSGSNNFNLIRMVLSFLVFFCHCYALWYGKAANVMDPISAMLGHWVGDLAVDGFFAISGFLVTGSILRSNTLSNYIISRILRIYPGLLVMLLMVIFLLSLLGPNSFMDYISSKETVSFIIHNATLVFDVKYNLPGLFFDNPYPKAVNGSLWTLPYEIRFYLLLGLVWLIPQNAFLSRRTILWLFVTLVMVGLLVAHFQKVVMDAHYIRFGVIFCVGSLLRQFSAYIPVSRVSIMLAIMVFLFSLRSPLPSVIYLLVLPYMVISLAYSNIRLARAYARVGDYSYGMYIYSFPVQQVISSYWHDIGIFWYIVCTFALTMLLSYFSWWFIEKPAIDLRKKIRHTS